MQTDETARPLVDHLRDGKNWLNGGKCCGAVDASGTCMAPACIFGEALKWFFEAADEIDRQESMRHAALSTAREEGRWEGLREAAEVADEKEHEALASQRYNYVPASVSNPRPKDTQETRNKHLGQVASLWRDFAADIRALTEDQS